MAGILFYAFASLATLIGSVFLAGLFFFLVTKIGDFIKQRKIPKDKKQVSLFLASNKDLFKLPQKAQEIDKKEVEENERLKSAKFREFEKLRSIRATSTGNSKQRSNHKFYEGNGELQKRELLPVYDDKYIAGIKSEIRGAESKLAKRKPGVSLE